MALEDVPRCQHVKINGTQCGSPALRSRRFCYFHNKIRREKAKIASSTAAVRFDLPLLEDPNSVQVALMKVVQMLGSGTLDHRTAGLMLYALQTASINLRHTDFEATNVTDVVIDRDTVAATCIEGPQWFEEDFAADEDDEEADQQEEAADEEPVTTIHASAEPPARPAAKNQVKRVTADKAPKPVQAVTRSWLPETAAQKSQ